MTQKIAVIVITVFLLTKCSPKKVVEESYEVEKSIQGPIITDPIEIKTSSKIYEPVNDLWKKLSNKKSLSKYLRKETLVDHIGNTTKLSFKNEEYLTIAHLHTNQNKKKLSYTIESSSLPIKEGVITIKVQAKGKSFSLVKWSTIITPTKNITKVENWFKDFQSAFLNEIKKEKTPHIREHIIIDNYAENIWSKINKFKGIETYLPDTILASSINGLYADKGCIRTLLLNDSSLVKEIVRDINDETMTLTYARVQDSQWEDYESIMQVKQVSEKTCEVIWEATFWPNHMDQKQAERLIKDTYRRGLEHLANKYDLTKLKH